jgi:hypothetical protein
MAAGRKAAWGTVLVVLFTSTAHALMVSKEPDDVESLWRQIVDLRAVVEAKEDVGAVNNESQKEMRVNSQTPTSASTPITDARGHYKARAAAVATTATATCTSAWVNQGQSPSAGSPGSGSWCPSWASWCRWLGAGQDYSEQTTLSGSGTVAVDYSNPWEDGLVYLFLNGNLIRGLQPCTRATVNVDFQDGDILQLAEDGAIIGFSSVTCLAQGAAIDTPDTGCEVGVTCPAACSFDAEKASPTPAATPNPTSSPTPSPTSSPTSSPISVSGKGDPHLVNVHGQKFDLYQPGVHPLIRIPKSGRQRTALLVQARASRLGADCADLYFTEVNVTGKWTKSDLHYNAQVVHDETPQWSKFGPIELKVAHGHTEQGVTYLNFYVKHLGRAGFAVGGLLGEDDHGEAATPSAGCRKTMSLAKHLHGDGNAVRGASVATAMP